MDRPLSYAYVEGFKDCNKKYADLIKQKLPISTVITREDIVNALNDMIIMMHVHNNKINEWEDMLEEMMCSPFPFDKEECVCDEGYLCDDCEEHYEPLSHDNTQNAPTIVVVVNNNKKTI